MEKLCTKKQTFTHGSDLVVINHHPTPFSISFEYHYDVTFHVTTSVQP